LQRLKANRLVVFQQQVPTRATVKSNSKFFH